MDFLNINPVSGKISRVQDRSEISPQILSDQLVAKLKQQFDLVDMLVRNYIIDHPLVAHYLALQSEQELR